MTNKCSSCGLCCSLFFINLNKEEFQSGKYKTQFDQLDPIEDFSLAKECGANLLEKKENGECIYLKDNLCSIHKERPQACRDFFCTSKLKKFEKMIEVINKKRESLKE